MKDFGVENRDKACTRCDGKRGSFSYDSAIEHVVTRRSLTRYVGWAKHVLVIMQIAV